MSKRTKTPGGWSILRLNATKCGKRIRTIHRISLHIIIRVDQLIQTDYIASNPRRQQLLQSLPKNLNLAKKNAYSSACPNFHFLNREGTYKMWIHVHNSTSHYDNMNDTHKIQKSQYIN
jgi:bifunctional pyridoxal-dependent enzyme with beta-cystathionase and maltose regulon repressor activities